MEGVNVVKMSIFAKLIKFYQIELISSFPIKITARLSSGK